ncbi:MAG: TIGR01777 family oxidoreductase, partial [Aeoliella sp.]
RVEGTALISEAIAALDPKPKVLACASAIGFYGDRGDTVLDESAASGDSFLPEVCLQWERACKPARDAGIRVASMRLGVVLSTEGGALAQMLTPFKLGAGGVLGSGKQYFSWISLHDAARAIEHVLESDQLSGPVNLVAPTPVTNREFTKTLGKVLSRPTIAPMPAFAARLLFGEMADALLLASTRVIPTALAESGFHFQHPELETALHQLLRK